MVATAELAKAADIVGMDAFDCGWVKHTIRSAFAALRAFIWIDLPYGFDLFLSG